MDNKMVSIPEDILFNMTQDLRKKDISSYDKGLLILAYMKSKGITSIRQAAKDLSISKSTLEDWINYSKSMTKEEMNNLQNKGYTKTEIRKAVHDRNVEPLRNDMPNELDRTLKYVLKLLGPYVAHQHDFTSETSILLSDIKDKVNKIQKKLNL